MNTVKHWKDSNSQQSPKKRSRFWSNPSLTAVFLATLVATYLDLFFVGKDIYRFPMRLMKDTFSINIAFTLGVLPVLVFLFLQAMNQVNRWGKVGLILFISLLMPIFEKFAEVIGWFEHTKNWKHLYTFFGYLLFLTMIYLFYTWMEKRKD
ncbi:CBO0543 family protein [Neobacillus drentensis]|uniref:CBO0543 family protein n=1 Tax=Neobacillus drentensis TaxID=220684 RepID=UPI0008268539|nr:CBO0543 family protein [Neobacillus drentensis]